MMMTHKVTHSFDFTSPNWISPTSPDPPIPPPTKSVYVGLNDVFDPLKGFPNSKQPNFFDEMAVIYKHFKVVSWMVTIKLQPQLMEGSNLDPDNYRVRRVPHTIQLHIGPSDDGYADVTDPLDRALSPFTKTAHLGGETLGLGAAYGGIHSGQTFTFSGTTRQFYNLGDFADQKFSGNPGTSPTAVLRATLTGSSSQDDLASSDADIGEGDQWNYRAYITLTQNVLWYEPVTTAFSRDTV